MNLAHLTSKAENLKSILVHGFVPTVNRTTVWDEIFGFIGEEIPDIENGMISFTEIPDDISLFKDTFMRKHYGEFGVAVDFNWAIDRGVRRVVYIKKDSEEFNCIKTLLHKSFPKNNYESEYLDKSEIERVRRVFLNNPNLPDSFTNPLYSLMVYFMQWVETANHEMENEFRIRSPNAIRGLSGYTGFEQVNIVKILANEAITNQFIRIEKANVLYLFCPKEYREELEVELKDTIYFDVTIKCY